MHKCNYFKTILMMILFVFLFIVGGCGGGGGGSGNSVLPPTSPMLASLQLSIGELSPDFSPTIMQYTASVSNSVTSITVTSATTSANTLISVNGVNVASGSASGAINLNVGSNTITVIVGNPTGQTTYTLTVTRASEPIYQRITPESAHAMMAQLSGYILLDVRTQPEYDNERIPGAVLIPHTEIDLRAGTELPNKDQVIFVYCQAGIRSEIAARALVDLGYSNVYDFGGINDWPYEKTGNPPPPYWFDTADTSWWDVASNDSNFTISTPQQLAGIAKIINNGTTYFSGCTITLASDLDLAGSVWISINRIFQGVFDGGGHTISNMKIDSSEPAIGLFETLDASGTIKNVKLVNVDVIVCPT